MHKIKNFVRLISSVIATVAFPLATLAADVMPIPAVANGRLGLYPAQEFRIVKGVCADCPALKESMWYFGNDLIAIPKDGFKPDDYARGVSYRTDVHSWYQRVGGRDKNGRPGLIWIGSPELVTGVRLVADSKAIRLADGTNFSFAIVPKLASNRSYYDDATSRFFSERPVRIRGAIEAGQNAPKRIVARTIWPEDFAIDTTNAPLAPLAVDESPLALVRSGRDAGAHRSRVLWTSGTGQSVDWHGKAAIGVMLNGAQGDDDEAHGGHFAIATGIVGERGEYADWLVNNFYNLDSFSEKGIIAAMTPMDNYLADLNSGQSYYRPSYMLVAILKDRRTADAFQHAVARVYNHFYRHDFRYRHAGANCAGISIDTLRELGWDVPLRGPTSNLKAVAAYPYMSLKELSFDSGRQAFDYLREEQTRLYPAVAFDAIGSDLLALAAGRRSPTHPYEQMLKDDLEAVVYVNIPQFPSSRAQGSYPVASIDEYMARVPEDKAQWKIVPVEPRPFPQQFVNADTEPANVNNGAMPVTAGLVLIAVWGVRSVRRRRANGAK